MGAEMIAEELRAVALRHLDADDLYGLMLLVVRAWAERYHRGAEYAVVVVHARDGVPDVQVPVIPPGPSASAPPPQPA